MRCSDLKNDAGRASAKIFDQSSFLTVFSPLDSVASNCLQGETLARIHRETKVQWRQPVEAELVKSLGEVRESDDFPRCHLHVALF